MSVQYHKADPIDLEFQFRALPDGTSTFVGYASVFNQPSKPIVDDFALRGRPYIETILPGAFRRTLGSGSRKSLVIDHDENKMISSTPSGALKLSEDSTGLHVESPWPRTDYADNARALHEAGEPLTMSMLFAAPRGGDVWDPGHTSRSVSEAILRHVSVLATQEAAYAGTTASIRSLDDLAAYLLADVDALSAACQKLANGEPLTTQEAELLEAAIEHLEPPDADEDDAAAPMTDDAGRAVLDRWTKRLEEIEADLPKS